MQFQICHRCDQHSWDLMWSDIGRSFRWTGVHSCASKAFDHFFRVEALPILKNIMFLHRWEDFS